MILPVGQRTLAWLRQGGIPNRAAWIQRCLLRWQSLWFERNLSLQHSLAPAPYLYADPIFILGLWRSGTTYLHDLLSTCPEIISPRTWQCMNPSVFRLRPPPAADQVIRRPMDGVTIDALSPQEDEFALLALGAPSVYRGFLDPRRLPELSGWLDPNAWSKQEPDDWLPPWLDFLAGVGDGKPGRLLLKSPNHTFRIRALAEIFPRASYVWLVRDPLKTFLSNRKMWLAMFQRYALWHWDTALLDDFLCSALANSAKCLIHAKTSIPKERLVVISFDELTESPLSTVEHINARLALGDWSRMHATISRIVADRSSYRPDRYDLPVLTTETRALLAWLSVVQQEALISHGL